MSDVDVDTDDSGKKRQVATHALIDANGKVVDDMESATGIRYTDDQSGLTRDQQWAALPDYAQRWAGMFGLKTLWTNEASQVRQAYKKANGKDAIAPGKEQMAGIDQRMNLWLNDKQYVDRTREAMVWEIDTLIAAGVNVMVASGDCPDTAEDRAAFTKKLTDYAAADPGEWTRKLRGVEGVENEYRRLKGGITKKSAGSLAAELA